ncbi:MAG: hypothetical protein KAI83_11240 [Thiomargarita sp.]|nr:hypothetical protein [Thiomargarita sp.]
MPTFLIKTLANQEIRFFQKIGFLNSCRHSTQSVEEGVPKQSLGTRDV